MARLEGSNEILSVYLFFIHKFKMSRFAKRLGRIPQGAAEISVKIIIQTFKLSNLGTGALSPSERSNQIKIMTYCWQRRCTHAACRVVMARDRA